MTLLRTAGDFLVIDGVHGGGVHGAEVYGHGHGCVRTRP